MIVTCVPCGQEVVVSGSVGDAVCPCGSRCFKWDDEGAAASLTVSSELMWNGAMSGKRTPVWTTRQGFRVSVKRVA